MRLVRAVLFVALTTFTGSLALADDAKPADPKPEVTKKKVPYRVVKILPESQQVLLFDKIHGTHVLAEAGEPLDAGYTLDEIDDDEVTLVADDGSSVILTAPPPPHQKKAKKAKAQPIDPYADAGEAVASVGNAGEPAAATPSQPAPNAGSDATTSVPVDPYAAPEPPVAGEGGVRSARAAASEAPPAPAAPIVDSGAPELSDPYGDPGIRAFAEAVGATPAPAAPAATPAAKPAKAKAKAKPVSTPDAAAALAAAATGDATVEVPAAAPTSPAGGIVLARTDLDAALADFGRLAASFRATFTPEGLRFDAIDDGTLLAKAGLHKGDVVTAVDGRPLRSLDDAANLYARSSTVKSATVQVLRGGKPVTLRVAIQ